MGLGDIGSFGVPQPGPGAGPAGLGTMDPVLAAYLSAIGFDSSAVQAAADKRVADINAQAAFQQPEIDYRGDLALQAANNDAVGRGIWSSGERLVNRARAQHAQQFATGQLELNRSQSVGDAQLALARSLADNESRKKTALVQSQQTTTGYP